MKATLFSLAAVLGVLAAAPLAQAQYCCPPLIQYGPPPYCWYQQDVLGHWYGPNCYLTPPYPPFQGMVFAPPRPAPQPGMQPRPGMVAVPGQAPVLYGNGNGMGGIPAFPSHQWARSPRDFFMVD